MHTQASNKQHGVLGLKKSHIADQCVCCGSAQLKKSPAILMPFVAHRALGWPPVQIDDSWGLHSINNGFAYTICNSLYCESCGFLFLDIRFSDAEMNRLYHGYREKEYVDLRAHYEPGYRLRNDALNSGERYLTKVEAFLNPYLSMPVALLDWGGDTGKNSPFRNNSKYLHIYDISNKPVVDGAQQVDKITALQTDYDLVVCSQVLEHVPYPADVIMEMKQAMHANTILYIEVPYEALMRNAEDAGDLHLQKKHWHEHINFFNTQSLLALLKQCGLRVLAIKQIVEDSHGQSVHLTQVACQLAEKG
jgi:SAM-dependent methyltransferase